METCFNCGAEVRPGAKFCTSCGTRLRDNQAAPASEAASSQSTPAEETQVAAPAAREEERGDTGKNDPFAGWGRSSGGWNADEESAGTSSPADRFEAALDSREESSSGTTGGWGTPSPASDDRFASWSAAYGTSSNSSDTPDGDQDEGEIVSVESATISATGSDAGEKDNAGFSEGGELEVDDLSGDENIGAGEPDSGIAPGHPSDQSDTRQRATALIEELRELIWKIGEQEPASSGDTTDVRNALSAARGQTGDFSDLEPAIAAVRESPRDIDALRELGNHAARLEELMESHGRLTAALDDAIRNLQ